MDSSIAGLTGQPRPFSANGADYRLHKLDAGDLGKVQAWCDRQRPDPFAVVATQLGIGRFNAAQEKYLLAEAIRQASEPKPRLGSAECGEMITSYEGFAYVFFLSVSKGDPAFTEEKAAEAIRGFNAAHILAITDALSLDLIKGDPDDPKASTSGASTTPH